MAKKYESVAMFDRWSDRVLNKKMVEMLEDIRKMADGKNPKPQDPRVILEDTVLFSVLPTIRKAFLSMERKMASIEKRIAELKAKLPNETDQTPQ